MSGSKPSPVVELFRGLPFTMVELSDSRLVGVVTKKKQFKKLFSELNFPAKKGPRPQNDARVALGNKNGFKRPVATGFGQPPWSRSK